MNDLRHLRLGIWSLQSNSKLIICLIFFMFLGANYLISLTLSVLTVSLIAHLVYLKSRSSATVNEKVCESCPLLVNESKLSLKIRFILISCRTSHLHFQLDE